MVGKQRGETFKKLFAESRARQRRLRDAIKTGPLIQHGVLKQLADGSLPLDINVYNARLSELLTEGKSR